MWRLGWVQPINFGSFGEHTPQINLRDTPLMILGENHDDASGVSNGSGKSLTVRSVLYALLGRIDLKGVSADEVILDGAKWCQVNLCLTDGTDELVIRRGRKGVGPFLTVELNGDSSQNPRTNDQKQEYLLNLLGVASGDLGMNIFMNTCFLTGEWDGFASKNTTSSERFEIVSSVLDLDAYSDAAEEARKRLKKVSTEVTALRSRAGAYTVKAGAYPNPQASLEDFEGKLEFTKTALQHLNAREHEIKLAQQRLEDSLVSRRRLQSTLASQQSLLTKTVNDRLGVQKKLVAVDGEINKCSTEAHNLNVSLKGSEAKMAAAEQRKSDNEQAIVAHRAKVTELRREVEVLRKQLKAPSSCPSCQSLLFATKLTPLTLELVDEAKQKEISQSIQDYETGIKSHSVEVQGLEEQNRQIAVQINEFKGKLTAFNTVHAKIENLEKEETSLKEQEQSLENSESMMIAQVKETENSLSVLGPDETEVERVRLNDDLDQVKQEADTFTITKRDLQSCIARAQSCIEAQDEQAKIREQIEALQETESDLQFWVKAFPDIRGKLMDEFIPELESLTNENLASIGSSMQVEMSTTSDTKKGHAVSDFNIMVWDDVGRKRNYRTFSKGEGTRLRLCNALALSDCLRQRGKIAFDFLLLDEVSEGLDPVAVKNVLNLLERVGGQVIVVTHDSALAESISNKITVVREGGISTVVR